MGGWPSILLLTGTAPLFDYSANEARTLGLGLACLFGYPRLRIIGVGGRR